MGLGTRKTEVRDSSLLTLLTWGKENQLKWRIRSKLRKTNQNLLSFLWHILWTAVQKDHKRSRDLQIMSIQLSTHVSHGSHQFHQIGDLILQLGPMYLSQEHSWLMTTKILYIRCIYCVRLLQLISDMLWGGEICSFIVWLEQTPDRKWNQREITRTGDTEIMWSASWITKPDLNWRIQFEKNTSRQEMMFSKGCLKCCPISVWSLDRCRSYKVITRTHQSDFSMILVLKTSSWSRLTVQ